jgi:hypothetical protein
MEEAMNPPVARVYSLEEARRRREERKLREKPARTMPLIVWLPVWIWVPFVPAL